MRQKLIDCRENKTRQEVADDLDITPQMLGAIERGDRTPSLKLAKRISDYYGMLVDEIFFNQNGNETFPRDKKAI